MSTRDTFLAEARKRILITDGAFGTEIQNWKLSEADYAGSLGLAKDQKGNNDILALTKPEVPEAIHRAYFEAGADIAEQDGPRRQHGGALAGAVAEAAAGDRLL